MLWRETKCSLNDPHSLCAFLGQILRSRVCFPLTCTCVGVQCGSGLSEFFVLPHQMLPTRLETHYKFYSTILSFPQLLLPFSALPVKITMILRDFLSISFHSPWRLFFFFLDLVWTTAERLETGTIVSREINIAFGCEQWGDIREF